MLPLIPAMLGTLAVALACFGLGWLTARALYGVDVSVRRIEGFSSAPAYERVREMTEGVAISDR